MHKIRRRGFLRTPERDLFSFTRHLPWDHSSGLCLHCFKNGNLNTLSPLPTHGPEGCSGDCSYGCSQHDQSWLSWVTAGRKMWSHSKEDLLVWGRMIKGDWILIAFHWETLKYNIPVTRFNVGDYLWPKNSALLGPLVKERDIHSFSGSTSIFGWHRVSEQICMCLRWNRNHWGHLTNNYTFSVVTALIAAAQFSCPLILGWENSLIITFINCKI